MQCIDTEAHQTIAVLRMTNGATNAISPPLVAECTDALTQIQQNYRGMVLAGGAKFFCIGLDLPALLPFSRAEMIDFWRSFDRMVLTLYTLPIPTACAIAGHATAGGTILALACDFRYIAAEKPLMGLNEIKIGVPVPYLADLMLRQIVGDRTATEMTYTGQFLNPDQAAATGLVDGVCGENESEAKAIEKVAEIAGREQKAFTLIKSSRVEEVAHRFEQNVESRLDQFLDCWFDVNVQTLLHQAAEKF